MTTDLVVADKTRGMGAITLAVSPSLKQKGVKNRCRLFEIPDNLEYICAKPHMKLYIKYSADIYGIYLKYICKDDILVYSIDECFIDATSYLKMYKMTPHELAKKLVDEVYVTTKIRATVGIGTNMFLAKVALDIMAKRSSDFMGELDEESFKKEIWYHKPIEEIWNIGRGTAKRLAKYNAYTLYDVCQLDEKLLYKEFGVVAEYLIDHAHGFEPCTISDVHNYKPKSNSMSNGQVLFEDYAHYDALLVLKEMVELHVLNLLEKHLVTNNISLSIGYSKDIIPPKLVSKKLDGYTNSYKVLNEAFIELYEKTVNYRYMIRKLNISFNNLKDEMYQTITLFTDEEGDKKERQLQNTIILIKNKYGKNAILKGMNLEEKATTKKRNTLIGGHNSE